MRETTFIIVMLLQQIATLQKKGAGPLIQVAFFPEPEIDRMPTMAT